MGWYLQGLQGGADCALALPDPVLHLVQLGLQLLRILQRLIHLKHSTRIQCSAPLLCYDQR